MQRYQEGLLLPLVVQRERLHIRRGSRPHMWQRHISIERPTKLYSYLRARIRLPFASWGWRLLSVLSRAMLHGAIHSIRTNQPSQGIYEIKREWSTNIMSITGMRSRQLHLADSNFSSQIRFVILPELSRCWNYKGI